ncbi:MAG: hypothetical protein DLM58_00770 [Pseudonocardiales bacterium]|nr:MAG: hypothetical protein DLM58_00770 [Pseudonocardiales bacterium]
MRAAADSLTRAPAPHLVHFYDGDSELIDTVGDYLADGIRAGDAAVIVATATHRIAFEAALTARGVNVAAARACGAYVVLDAEETLRQFLVADWPERIGFELVVRAAIRSACDTGRPVRVFGEMVALLWDAGHVYAAIELESLWNELGRQLTFTLMCAYPAQSVSGDDHLAALADLCELHSAVVGEHRESSAAAGSPGVAAATARAFDRSYDSPRAARRFVLDALRQWGHYPLLDDAGLIVTELATNAVLHARTEYTVHVSSSAHAIRIAVRDSSPTPPSRRDASLVATSGRGLGIVAALADQWNVESVTAGKSVWAELRYRGR